MGIAKYSNTIFWLTILKQITAKRINYKHWIIAIKSYHGKCALRPVFEKEILLEKIKQYKSEKMS